MGQQLNRQYYLPYGQIRHTDGLPPDIGYTGQRLDDSTGLMFYNARYYDPLIGRFTTADTTVPNPTNPQDYNRYTYVRNNLVRYTDPTGHCTSGGRTGLENDSTDDCKEATAGYMAGYESEWDKIPVEDIVGYTLQIYSTGRESAVIRVTRAGDRVRLPDGRTFTLALTGKWKTFFFGERSPYLWRTQPKSLIRGISAIDVAQLSRGLALAGTAVEVFSVGAEAKFVYATEGPQAGKRVLQVGGARIGGGLIGGSLAKAAAVAICGTGPGTAVCAFIVISGGAVSGSKVGEITMEAWLGAHTSRSYDGYSFDLGG